MNVKIAELGVISVGEQGGLGVNEFSRRSGYRSEKKKDVQPCIEKLKFPAD
jgi:hypothetical protein